MNRWNEVRGSFGVALDDSRGGDEGIGSSGSSGSELAWPVRLREADWVLISESLS